MVLIVSGTVCIILLANKQQEEYKGSDMLDLIGETKAIIFFIVVGLLNIITHFVVYFFQKSLRTFELDADLQDHKTRR